MGASTNKEGHGMSKQFKYTKTFEAAKLACERIPGSVRVRARADAGLLNRLNRLNALAAENSGTSEHERALAAEMARKLAERPDVASLLKMEVRISGPEALVNKIRCYVAGDVLHIDGPEQTLGEVLALGLLADVFGSNIVQQVDIVVVVPGTITRLEQQMIADRTFVYAPPRKPGSSRS
jgi:hypothetical protein